MEGGEREWDGGIGREGRNDPGRLVGLAVAIATASPAHYVGLQAPHEVLQSSRQRLAETHCRVCGFPWGKEMKAPVAQNWTARCIRRNSHHFYSLICI